MIYRNRQVIINAMQSIVDEFGDFFELNTSPSREGEILVMMPEVDGIDDPEHFALTVVARQWMQADCEDWPEFQANLRAFLQGAYDGFTAREKKP